MDRTLKLVLEKTDTHKVGGPVEVRYFVFSCGGGVEKEFPHGIAKCIETNLYVRDGHGGYFYDKVVVQEEGGGRGCLAATRDEVTIRDILVPTHEFYKIRAGLVKLLANHR